MTRKEHLQFIALMLPTIMLLALAAVSMASPAIELLCSAAKVATAQVYTSEND